MKSSKEELRITLLGATSVGKTCILARYTTKRYEEDPPSNICAGNYYKEFDNYVLNIWDTAGKEMFHSLTRIYTKDSAAVILVYDPCNRESFDALRFYVEIAQQTAIENALYVVVQNKNDIREKIVSESEGEQYANSLGGYFCVVSALTGQGIENLFKLIFSKSPWRYRFLSLFVNKKKRKINKIKNKCLV